MKDIAGQFIKYVNKTYGFWQGLKRVNDGRKSPHVPVESVLACLIMGLVCRLRSLNQIEGMIQAGAFDRSLGCLPKPSADTLAYALSRIDVGSLKRYLWHVVNKARLNKVPVGDIQGHRAVAIDGSEVYSSNSERMSCTECKTRKVGEGVQFYEQAVVMSYVGEFPLVLGIRRVKRGQGEVSAGVELIRELGLELFRYCDIIVADALYAQAPFIKAVLAENKHVLVKVKQENREIIADAEGLFAARGPDLVLEGVRVHPGAEANYDVKIWDEEGFTSWSSLGVPVRCIRVEETVTRVERGQLVKNTYVEYLVTTCPKATTSARVLWTIMHRRWDIENSVFHSLKTYSSFEHCFCHDENAVPAMWLLMAIAFNLLRLFALRNLREIRDFMGIAMMILITLPRIIAPIYVLIPDPG